MLGQGGQGLNIGIFAAGDVMSKLLPFKPPPDAEEHARAETERKQRLFAWADRLLQQLGLAERVSQANSFEELRKIAFDADAVEVGLAIRDVLHPISGPKADCFVGIREGGLKKILKNRFDELKRYREMGLRNHSAAGGRSAYDWTDDLKLDDKGGVRPLLTNLILFLREHPKFKGVLAHDEFNARVVIRKRPPWGEEAPDTPWTDHHESLVRVWFQGEDIYANQGDAARAVQAAARGNPFHPVRDYFDALVWDGTPRLDTWLSTYLHAEDTDYTRAIGPRFMISACARIYEPGCKVDHMIVLEGPQGRQKSEALRTLAGEQWFTDRLSHVASKDAALETAGVLLVEIAEMDALTKASNSAIKAFLTRRFDRFRPPGGKHPVRLPRQCVFAGTINPVVGGYLTDPTGARRIWPVACHGMIDREGIERDRDQIWAEAIARFKAGAVWWLETPELEALATSEQAARFKADVWKEPIEEWLHNRRDASISEVLEQVLGFAPREQTHSAEIRVANILTLLDFTRYRARRDGARQNRYWRPTTEPNPDRSDRSKKPHE
jgi:predicted P-loop ATPase